MVRRAASCPTCSAGPANIWSLGIGLDLPLFDAGRRSARVDQATAQQKQALAAYVSTVRGAFTDVRDALVAGAQYAQSVSALQAQTDAAQTQSRTRAEAS
jgi:multidrug efflux system outer membrane protein